MISDPGSLGSEERPKEQSPPNRISYDNNEVTKSYVTSALLLILDNVADDKNLSESQKKGCQNCVYISSFSDSEDVNIHVLN